MLYKCVTAILMPMLLRGGGSRGGDRIKEECLGLRSGRSVGKNAGQA